MRLLPTILVAASAGIASAASSSDLEQTIIDSFDGIVKLTNNVTGYIKAFHDLNSALPITPATDKLISYIANATMEVKNDPANLTQSEAQTLGAYSQELAYTVNASIATLIGKKPLFESLNLGGLVISSLKTQANSSKTFSGAILAKIPDTLAPVSAAISGQITDSIQQGIDCFNGKNETCNSNVVNATRTYDAAMDTGAIPKSAAGERMGVAGYVVVLGAAFVAFAVGV